MCKAKHCVLDCENTCLTYGYQAEMISLLKYYCGYFSHYLHCSGGPKNTNIYLQYHVSESYSNSREKQIVSTLNKGMDHMKLPRYDQEDLKKDQC